MTLLLQMEYRSSSTSVEIPIWVDRDKKWLTGLTKRTTCDDIIYALLSTERKEELDYAHTYAIYERWRDVERPLQGRTKILRVWKAWGAEQKNVRLQLQKFEDLHYSVEWVKPKRRHLRRSRSRSSSSRGSQCKCPHCAVKERGNLHKPRSLESLVETVTSQEEQIQSLYERIQDTDRLIESYETRVHHHRLKHNGQNYVQDAYLESLSDDSVEDFAAGMDPLALENYLKVCDSIIELEDRIHEEKGKIQNLSVTLKQEMCNRSELSSHHADSRFGGDRWKDPYSRGYSNPDGRINSGGINSDCRRLQVEINRSTAQNLEQGIQLENLNKDLRCCNQEWQQKKDLLDSLIADLETVTATAHPGGRDMSQEVRTNGWGYRDVNRNGNLTVLSPDQKHYSNTPVVPLENRPPQTYLYNSCRQENIHRLKQKGLALENCLYGPKQDDNDSDTGLSSMHSDESPTALETLV